MKRESGVRATGTLAAGLAPGSSIGRWLIAISLAAGLLAGCRGSMLNPKSDLELRLDAANQVTIAPERNKSLASIATDAAEEGDFRTTQKALLGINDPSLKDATAAECAVRLVKAGDRSDANKLTLTIKDTVVRNETLRRLANNDVGDTEPAAGNPPAVAH